MRLLILDENYPHLGNLLGDVFVHVRAKEYASEHEVRVFSYFHEDKNLVYEGIEITMFQDESALTDAIAAYKPDKILIHFYQAWMLEKVIKKFKIPVIIWVHGYEALGWYRRLFNYTWYSPVLLNHIKRNTKQQYHFNRLIKYANQGSGVHFVFVSKWMWKITEQDTFRKIKKFDIIANPIDINLFKYEIKDEALRKKVLVLRSFGSKKYANDISVKAILNLSGRKCFKEFSFTIIGDGPLFDKTTAPLKAFGNVRLEKRVVRQNLIPEIHKEHGIFLCPSRQDAQGVSMCEAMASGLVPVTSNNTALPEFVKDRVTGILTHSSGEIADALEELLENPELFSRMSLNTAKSIRELCDIKSITQKELLIIAS